jgi:glucuronoarabinoxylan endo-1,4-beta-xylanase
MKKWLILAFLLIGPVCYGQSATINWTNVHQIIDGFGASDEDDVLNSSSMYSFFFGQGTGQLGLSILRIGVTNDGGASTGDCTSISTSCAGVYLADAQAMVATGGRIYATPWSPPPAYKSSGTLECGTLNNGDYSLYATWLANFVQSLAANGVPLYAMSVQNEPDECGAFASTSYAAANLDTFVGVNLGPTFATDGISTLIFGPETVYYSDLTSYGGACATDSTCYQYLGGFNFHDYGTSYTAPDSVSSATYPSGWPTKKYWETEASCDQAGTPNFCPGSFNNTSADAMAWAAIIDQRVAVDGVNAWLWWWFTDGGPNGEALMQGSTAAERAYVLGQYARFIRPGYYRIDATHIPQSGVSVSAYQNTPGGNLVIVATNYTASPVTQTFALVNAPTFSSVTPYVTSATQDIQAQSLQPVSSNSFAYTLPADSVTTFVGASSGLTDPAAPTNLQATIN